LTDPRIHIGRFRRTGSARRVYVWRLRIAVVSRKRPASAGYQCGEMSTAGLFVSLVWAVPSPFMT